MPASRPRRSRRRSRTPAAGTASVRLRALPAAHRPRAQLDHRARAPRRSAAREGPAALRRAAPRRRGAGGAAPGAGGGAQPQGRDGVAGADDAGARQLGAHLAPLPAAGRRGQGRRAGLESPRLGGRVLLQVPARGPRGRGQPPQEPGARSTNRRSGAHLERILREAGRHDELLALYTQRAERAPTREERTAASVAAGELCERLERPADAFEPLPQGAGEQPQRAARAEGRPRRADHGPGLGGARQGPGGGRPHQARRAGRGAAGRSGDADLEAARPARHGGVVLPAGAQARSRPPGDGRVLPRVPRRAERAAAAAGDPGAGPEDRARRRAPAGHGDRDGARRRAAAATRRQGHRDLEGPPAPAAAPPEAVASLRKLYTATEKWNALLELLKDDLNAVPAADVDERSTASSRSSPSTATG